MAERFPLLSMGETAEEVAAKWKISREEQDAFALASQKKAAAAVAAGVFDREIVPVSIPAAKKGAEPVVFARDESPRGDTTLEALAKLPTVFRKGGTVTAGNSSPLNDGASGVLVASEEVVRAHGLEPLATRRRARDRRRAPEHHGRRPDPRGDEGARAGRVEGEGPRSRRAQRGLRGAGARVHPRSRARTPSASTSTAARSRSATPSARAGARILGTLLWAMKARGARRGMAALCIGVGQGIAMAVER